MPDLILHIGWHKTGSTALQSFLCQTDLRANGLTYLHKGPRRPAYNTVQFGLSDPERLAKDQNRLREQVANLDTRTAIISAEVFSTLPPAFVAKWLGAVDWANIRIVAYLRRQDMYLESLYKQGVKWGKIKVSFQNFLRSYDLRRADYARVLQSWANTFPHAELTPRIYDPENWAEGIVTDFSEVIGLPPELTANVRHENHNTSPSSELTDLYRQLNSIENLQRVNRKVINSGLPGLTGNQDCLSLTERQALLDRFAPSNDEVRSLYFPERASLFDAMVPASPKTEFDKDSVIAVIISAIAELNGPEAALRAKTSLKGSTT